MKITSFDENEKKFLLRMQNRAATLASPQKVKQGLGI
jgi:hypothetical protein